MAALLLTLLLLLFPSVIFAATSLSTGSIPTTIDQAQEFELDVLLTCTTCTSDSYLRGVFYPGGTSYFGFTLDNSGNWVNVPGGSCTQYFKVAVSDLKDGSWSGKLKVKPDSAHSLYSGPGDYLFKIGRYTGSCGSPTWSSETTVAITGPTPTPTPDPTATPTPTPHNTPTPTPTPSLTPTRTPTPTPTVRPKAEQPPSGTQSALLLVSSQSAQTSISAGQVLGGLDPPSTVSATDPNRTLIPWIISLALVGLGSGILSFALVWQKRNS